MAKPWEWGCRRGWFRQGRAKQDELAWPGAAPALSHRRQRLEIAGTSARKNLKNAMGPSRKRSYMAMQRQQAFRCLGRRPGVKAHNIYFIWAVVVMTAGGVVHLLTRLS
jgi:hypothetical protein